MRCKLLWLFLGLFAALLGVDVAGRAQPEVLEPITLKNLVHLPAPKAWMELFQEVARPDDVLVKLDGTKLVVEPLSIPLRPGQAADVEEVRPIRAGEPESVRGSELKSVSYFEDRLLARVQEHLKEPSLEDLDLAEKALCAGLRWQRSARCAPPLTENPWQDRHAQLAEALLKVRRELLQSLVKQGKTEAALQQAERWLPLVSAESPLRQEIRALWARRGEHLIEAKEYKQARAWLDRIDRTFAHSSEAEPLRQALRKQAEALALAAKDEPAAQGLRSLQEALTLWPTLPGARDELERRRGTYQVLRVAVRTLPEELSPATAWTDVEKQSLDLVFESVLQPRRDKVLGRTYVPVLARALPTETEVVQSMTLRNDVTWSDGTHLTPADVRATMRLNGQPGGAPRAGAYRDLVPVPRFEGDAERLSFSYRQGSFDPLAALVFRVLPQQYRGRPLQRADDPDFARSPVGSGPYVWAGLQKGDQGPHAVFRASPYHVGASRAEVGSLREIHLLPWRERLPDLAALTPHLVWDVPTAELDTMRRQGFSEIRTLPTPRVWCLAINQRKPALGRHTLRRALAFNIDRETLLDHHFRGPAGEQKNHRAANGPFPAGSWAAAPATRVPVALFQPDRARSLAKQLKVPEGALELSLKYPDDDPRVRAACEELARQVSERMSQSGVKIAISAQACPPHVLQRALRERDYDLAYLALDQMDDPWQLWSLFDPQPAALEPGGSNFLGATQDAKLQHLLRTALQHRDFRVLQETMQSIHAHFYETQPLIPLWQLDTHVAIHRNLRVPELDALALFADVTEWKLNP